YFPRLVIPVSSILVAVFDFLMAFVLFIPLLAVMGPWPSLHAFWCWPLAIALCVIATLGPGCLLAALNVKYRDFRYVIPFIIQILFFMTPIIYPVSMLSHPVLKFLMVASPMYASVELFRIPISTVPPDWSLIFISISVSLVLLIAGLVYFKKTEDFFADFA
ncbi:MAG TPA: ABC transporter permease, partial [Chryseosolibacter sp.]|nr:ABC transporter permease [Chryseosolibacter sp.]